MASVDLFRMNRGQIIQSEGRSFFEICDYINCGSFGVIHHAKDLEKNIMVVIKLEKNLKKDNYNPQLKQERNIYM
jgi:hypothetical protein